MYDLLKKRSAVYRLRDGINIEDFEFEVRLQQINSLLHFSSNGKTTTTTSPFSPSPLDNNNESQKNSESLLNDGAVLTTRCKWQEKLLSPSETALYSDAKNCTTDTQRQYHHWLTQATASTTASAAEDTPRGKRRTKKQRRRRQQTQSEQRHIIYTYVQTDDFVPKDVLTADGNVTNAAVAPNGIERTPPDDVPYQYMYVYAALKPDTELMRFIWDPAERQLYVYPDFCQSHEQLYFMEIDSNCRHLYTYNCMNVTTVRQQQQRRRQKRQRQRRNSRDAMSLPWQEEEEQYNYFMQRLNQKRCPAVPFSLPPLRSTRVTFFFELVAGQYFDYDNIHVRYHIQLPDHTVHEHGLLAASTHSSFGSRQVAHFAHNWQVSLLCDELYVRHEQMRIYFEVIAIDRWSCERDEGYAHYACHLLEPLPMTTSKRQQRHGYFDAAHRVKTLQCVRPAGNWLDALRRYFVGGRPSFDYVKYFSMLPLPLPSALVATDAAACNGFPMLHTGQLLFKVTKLQQNAAHYVASTSAAHSKRDSRPRDMNFDDVVRSYQEAQMRLEQMMLELRNNQNNNNDMPEKSKDMQRSNEANEAATLAATATSASAADAEQFVNKKTTASL